MHGSKCVTTLSCMKIIILHASSSLVFAEMSWSCHEKVALINTAVIKLMTQIMTILDPEWQLPLSLHGAIISLR